MENNTKNIYQKLFALKSEVGVLSKDLKNPFYKSKYFDINQIIEHIEPLLQKNGLILLQPIKDNKVSSEIIDIESGNKIESFLELPQYSDPQKTGSAITYYRRYTLQSLLGLQAEDDDANKTVPKTKPNNPETITEWLKEDEFNRVMASTDVKELTDFGRKWNEAPKGMKKEYKAAIISRIKDLKTQKQ